MTLATLDQGRDVLGRPLPQVPEEWTDLGGTAPEYYIYLAIERTGRQHGVDFWYQRAFLGGRLVRGGITPDFIIQFPRVGINVQGERYHFPPLGSPRRDQMQRVTLERMGIRMEYISENEARSNPDGAVRGAIAGTRGRGPLGAFGR